MSQKLKLLPSCKLKLSVNDEDCENKPQLNVDVKLLHTIKGIVHPKINEFS